MRVVIFGASGMVGQGVLRECLRDSAVVEVLSVSRSALDESVDKAVDRRSPKLRELVRPDVFIDLDFTPIAHELTGFDACFFSLGVSSFRMKEGAYTRVTRDMTLAAARVLAQQNPAMIFVYVSGQGTNVRSRTMWARVKGATENALLAMPFRRAYMFRPGIILAKNGIQSKVKLYKLAYRMLYPLVLLLDRFPKLATDTQTIGRAMLRAARQTPRESIWNTAGINRLGRPKKS
jgi:uncharacterized protein YbjT (DUF2867 family)